LYRLDIFINQENGKKRFETLARKGYQNESVEK